MTTTPPRQRDEDLVQALADGATDALDVLLQRHWGSAYRVAHRLTGDPVAAEDVAQEAFVKLLRGAARFEPGRGFGPWFFGILRHEASHTRRRRQRRDAHEARVEPLQQAQGDPVAQREAVGVYLERLPEQQRTPIALHYLGGLSFQEVADALGCPKGTVTSRIRRGLESLQSSVQVHGLSAVVALPLLADAPAPAAPAGHVLTEASQRPPPSDSVPLPPSSGALLASVARPRAWLAVVLAAVAVVGVGGALLVPERAPTARRPGGGGGVALLDTQVADAAADPVEPREPARGQALPEAASAEPEPAGAPGAAQADGATAQAVDDGVQVAVEVVDDAGQPVSQSELVMSYYALEGRPGPGQVRCDALGRATFRLPRGTAFEVAPVQAGHGRLLGFDADQVHHADDDLALKFVLTRLAHVRLVVTGDVAAGDAVEVSVLHTDWAGGEPELWAMERARVAVCSGGCGEESPGCLGGGGTDQFTDPEAPEGEGALYARLTYGCRLGQAGIVVPVFPGRVSLSLGLSGGRRTAPLELDVAPGDERACQVALLGSQAFMGVVRDATGAPVAGAEVRYSGLQTHPVETDAEGRFSAATDETTLRDVEVSAPGFATRTWETVPVGEPLDVSLERLAHVRLERGQLVGPGEVEWMVARERRWSSGSRVIEAWPATIALPAGAVELEITWEDGKPSTRHRLELVAGQTVTLHELDARRSDTLATIRVEGPAGGGTLSIQGADPQAGTAQRGRHPKTGTVERFERLPTEVTWWPGEWTVVVCWGADQRSVHRIALVAGGSVTIRHGDAPLSASSD